METLEYWNKFGLLNAQSGTTNDYNENCILYSVEFIALMNTLGAVDIDLEKRTRSTYAGLFGLSERPGLFHQQLENTGNPEYDYISHDNLTAIVAMLAFMGNFFEIEQIWKEMKRQNLKYDNLDPENPKRWVHPRDIIFVGYMAGSPVCFLLLPLLWIIMLESQLNLTKKPGQIYINTDGKLLNFVRIWSIGFRNKFLQKVFNAVYWLGRKITHYNWSAIFSIYFPESEHPNHKAAQYLPGGVYHV